MEADAHEASRRSGDELKDADFDSLLKVYYQRLFPFRELHSWLSYGSVEQPDYFLRREFSFTFAGDIYARFKAFADLDSFSRDIRRNAPHKIDIGAVYNVSPRDKATYGKAFVPLEKELVFDIDMTDYDAIRVCCKGANVCNSCWVWMRVAQLVLHQALTEDFGFEHVLWVYSGRRGIHGWVCDSRARRLTNEAREAVVSYLSVLAGGEGKRRKVELGSRLHPSLKRAFGAVLEPYFEDVILPQQGVLASPESTAAVLAYIPHAELREELSRAFDKESDPEQRWQDLKASVLHAMKTGVVLGDANPVHDIVFHYAYPRLDVNVSTGLNHLLKSPFCVHPSTGRICVPLDPSPDAVLAFDPLQVPTVHELIADINQHDRSSSTGSSSNNNGGSGGAAAPVDARDKGLKDYKKTKLLDHVAFFKTKFLRPLLLSVKRQALQERQQQNTTSLDF